MLNLETHSKESNSIFGVSNAGTLCKGGGGGVLLGADESDVKKKWWEIETRVKCGALCVRKRGREYQYLMPKKGQPNR